MTKKQMDAELNRINQALNQAADEIGAWLVAEGKVRARAMLARDKPAAKKSRVKPESKNQRAMALIRAGKSDIEVLQAIPDLKASHLGFCRRAVERANQTRV